MVGYRRVGGGAILSISFHGFRCVLPLFRVLMPAGRQVTSCRQLRVVTLAAAPSHGEGTVLRWVEKILHHPRKNIFQSEHAVMTPPSPDSMGARGHAPYNAAFVAGLFPPTACSHMDTHR